MRTILRAVAMSVPVDMDSGKTDMLSKGVIGGRFLISL
jgi:hypothetical protein